MSSAIANIFASLHYAFEQTIFPVIGTIFEMGLSALIGILLLKHGAGVQVMALVLLGGSLAGGIWQAIMYPIFSKFSVTSQLNLKSEPAYCSPSRRNLIKQLNITEFDPNHPATW